MFLIIVDLWIRESKDKKHLLTLHKDLNIINEQLQQGQINTIATLIKTVEAKDLYTSGHSERTTAVANAIAEEMKLDKHTREIISRAALLHDIGKIGISDSIIRKTSALTETEWELIKDHPIKAMVILEPLKFINEEKNIILHHHERYDGKGYPSGLKKDEIPLGAAIVAIADTFDAMNSSRSYRQNLMKEIILSELEKCKGKQHHPKAVDSLLIILRKKPELWMV